jgi:hypothetical protein
MQMGKRDQYAQCKLRRGTGEIQVAWIPAGIAKVGNTVRVRNRASEPWSEGWEVLSAGRPVDAATVIANAREWSAHRQVTDI